MLSMDNTANDRIYELETHLIQFNPLQPRGVITPDSLTELVDSIREQGILEPLVVADTPAGYQLIAGERRLRAAKILGFAKVPVVIKQATPQSILEMSIVENVQREDLNPIERALAYKRLIDEFGLGTTEVARKVGKSAPTISNTIRLLSLPDAIKDALVAGVITEGHVRPLISLGDPALMLDLFKKILRENSTVRDTEELARKAKSEVEKKEPHSPKTKIYNQELIDMSEQIKTHYNFSRVDLTQSGKKTRVTLEMNGDPETTTPILKQVVEKLLQG
jgi:ParB family chromosome partitioning protein